MPGPKRDDYVAMQREAERREKEIRQRTLDEVRRVSAPAPDGLSAHMEIMAKINQPGFLERTLHDEKSKAVMDFRIRVRDAISSKNHVELKKIVSELMQTYGVKKVGWMDWLRAGIRTLATAVRWDPYTLLSREMLSVLKAQDPYKLDWVAKTLNLNIDDLRVSPIKPPKPTEEEQAMKPRL